MVASAVGGKGEFSGLRAFNPLRDIRPVVALIELSFGKDLDPSSRQMLREMTTASWLLGPMFWLLSVTRSPLRDLFSGYVWLEQGRIVGNINVHTKYKGQRGWFISNLAVHPSYRRQDIALHLMRAGLELARGRGARRVSLEVRAGNIPAQRLYRKLGFAKVDSVSTMKLSGVCRVDAIPSDQYRMKVVKPGEWKSVHQLAQDTLSAEAKEIIPVMEKDYRQTFPRRLLSNLGDTLRGQIVCRWAAHEDDRFLGLVTLRVGGPLSSHSMRMMVHPDHRGKLEEMLLTKALSALNAYPSKLVSAKIQPSYEEAVDIFERYGFVEEQTLDLLTLRLERE